MITYDPLNRRIAWYPDVTIGAILGTPTARGIQKEIHISIRTDGKTGTGTAEDPFDGSTQAKYDAILNAAGPSTRVHLGVGTFLTSGHFILEGWVFVGAGKYLTTIKFLDGQVTGDGINSYILVGGSLVNYFEMSDLTLDANRGGQPGYPAATSSSCNALQAYVRNATVRNVRVIGCWANPGEGFPFHLIHGGGNHPEDRLIFENCENINPIGYCGGLGAFDQAGGVFGGWIKNCKVTDSLTGAGLGATGTKDYLIKDCTLSNVHVGIIFDTQNNDGMEITGCKIDGALTEGINWNTSYANTNLRIHDNIVRTAVTGGRCLYGAGGSAWIYNNTLIAGNPAQSALVIGASVTGGIFNNVVSETTATNLSGVAGMQAYDNFSPTNTYLTWNKQKKTGDLLFGTAAGAHITVNQYIITGYDDAGSFNWSITWDGGFFLGPAGGPHVVMQDGKSALFNDSGAMYVNLNWDDGCRLTNTILHKGSNVNGLGVYLNVDAITANRTVGFPDAGGTIVLDTATQTLTNKSISASQLNSGTLGTARLGSGTANTTTVLRGDSTWFTMFDGSGKIPTSLLPASVVGDVQYQGNWNASTNSPTIPAASSGNKGQYYVVSTAGATNIDGVTDWKVGDWLISNGTTWDKIDNTDAVTMVAGRVGAITLTASDITDSTTVGRAMLMLTNPGAVTFLRMNADNSVTARSAANFATDLGLGTGDTPAFTGLTVSGGGITGGAGNMTITSGTGNSRTMIFKTTTSGGTATTALTLNADQTATFAQGIATVGGAATFPITAYKSGGNTVGGSIPTSGAGMPVIASVGRFNVINSNRTFYFDVNTAPYAYAEFSTYKYDDATTFPIVFQGNGGNVGIGYDATGAPAAKLHVIATTEQLRVGYDPSNYFKTTVGSTGGVTFDAVGSGAAFTFSDSVTVNSTLTAAAAVITGASTLTGGITDATNIPLGTTTGTKLGTATGQKLGFWNATPAVQPTAVTDASGGAIVDAEARTALNGLLAKLRTIGIIAT